MGLTAVLSCIFFAWIITKTDADKSCFYVYNRVCCENGVCQADSSVDGSREIHECESNTCMNNGTCSDLFGSYTCICPEGYTGANCEINESTIKECALNPCQNGGSCTDLVGSYSCACLTGYTGNKCEKELSACISNPCLNGGTCNEYITLYTCTCAAGYSGNRCETNKNKCASNPCMNGGTCNDLELNSYSCTCPTGYSGATCEQATNKCDSNPCQNNGTCNDLLHAYTCTCMSGYTGTNCEQAQLYCGFIWEHTGERNWFDPALGYALNDDQPFPIIDNNIECGFIHPYNEITMDITPDLHTVNVTVVIKQGGMGGDTHIFLSNLTVPINSFTETSNSLPGTVTLTFPTTDTIQIFLPGIKEGGSGGTAIFTLS